MKKIIIFAGVMGFAAALAASAADRRITGAPRAPAATARTARARPTWASGSAAKDYSDATVQAALTDEAAFKAIKEGFKDKDGKTVMRPAANLSDDDIKGLVTYMRTFKK